MPMTKNFTRNDLILLIYNELPLQAKDELLQHIEVNQALKNEYINLKEAHILMRKVKLPQIDSRVTESILSYAAEAHSEIAGHV